MHYILTVYKTLNLVCIQHVQISMSRSSEVNTEQSIAIIEESLGFRLKPEYFQKYGNQSLEVQSDVGVTRGQVDSENNSQSQDLNILNNIHGESLIYGVRGQSISWGYWKCEREHSEAIYI